MQPDDLRWLHDTFAALGFAAIIGAGTLFLLFKLYLPSYLNEKGKNLATREDFDNLLEQVKKTTLETESIKTELVGRNWLTQQQWSIRERHYTNLLGKLWTFKLSLQDRDDYYAGPGSEHDDFHTETERFIELGQRGAEAFEAIRELIGPAAVFLSERTVEALNQLVKDHWGTAEFSSCQSDYLKSTLELADAAYVAVLAEAKNELAHASANA